MAGGARNGDPGGLGLLAVAAGMVTSAWAPALAVVGVVLGLVGLGIAGVRRVRGRRRPAPPRVAVVVGAAPVREPVAAPITVAAIEGRPWGVGPVAPAAEPAGPRLRVVTGGAAGGPATQVPGELVAESWRLASRRHAELVDAAAVELGLADLPPAAPPVGDPDPVLFSATGTGALAA